jgi:hypothetical protein
MINEITKPFDPDELTVSEEAGDRMRAKQREGYWFSLIVLQAFDFKLDRRDEPHLNSQYLPP